MPLQLPEDIALAALDEVTELGDGPFRVEVDADVIYIQLESLVEKRSFAWAVIR